MDRSPLHQQIDTLPELAESMVDGLVRAAARLLFTDKCRAIKQVFICGCGDSHHAGVNAELSFHQLAGIPCRATTAMHFGRFIAPYLGQRGPETLVLAISVSGQVSRTVEALEMARLAGATAIAITGNRQSPLAAEGELVLHTAVPPLPYESPPDSMSVLGLPGARSYIASQLALYVLAIQLGQLRGRLKKTEANALRAELVETGSLMERTIAACDPLAARATYEWRKADTFVFCGSGPNYGTALFSAAKILEASGDAAVAQDMEEWAHLEYFAREVQTPTFLINTAERDANRTLEVATAAHAIGRRTAVIAAADSSPAQTADKDLLLPLAGPPRECFAPLVSCLPGLLFAAYRSQLIAEPYFRAFSGGRSPEDGGGISRIRTSLRMNDLAD